MIKAHTFFSPAKLVTRVAAIFFLSAFASTTFADPFLFADKQPQPFNNPAQEKAWNQRVKRFAQLWLSRRDHKAAPQLLKMLAAEPTPYLREHIVIALGIIEDPQAIKPLENLLSQAKLVQNQRSHIWRDQVPPLRIRLAIGRIRSHNLRGEAKLNTIAASVGQNWNGIKRIALGLRSQLRGKGGNSKVGESENYVIIQEFYDILYRMGKNKEKIMEMGAGYIPVRPQRAYWLKTSSLSDAEEVRFLLKVSMPPSKFGFHPAHLLDLGTTVESELLQHLKRMLLKAQNYPKTFSKTSVYTVSFEAAAQTGNAKFLPVLRGFLKVDDVWPRISAERAIKILESKKNMVAFP